MGPEWGIGWGMGWMRWMGIAMAAACLAGCATTPLPAVAPDDPFERTNRENYKVNDWLVRNVTLPVAWVAVHVVPKPISVIAHNVMSNLDAPVVFTNKVLQGKLDDAGRTALRFTVNSTIGLGGILDPATKAGLPQLHADFGQTLASYGVPSGPFLMMPVMGPNTPRDLLGDAVDFALDPLTYVPASAPLVQRLGTTALIRVGSPFPFWRSLFLFSQFFGKHPHSVGLIIRDRVFITEIEVIAQPLFIFRKT